MVVRRERIASPEEAQRARVEIEPKSRAGRRTVPIVGALRHILVDDETRQDREAGLVFSTNGETQS